MFYFLLSVLCALPYLLYYLAKKAPLGLKGTMLHPFNILGVFVIIVSLDFLEAWNRILNGQRVYFAQLTVDKSNDILFGMIFILICLYSVAAGIAIAIERPLKKQNVVSVDDNIYATVLFILIFTSAVIVAVFITQSSINHHSILYVASIRTSWFRNNQYFYLIISLLLPAFFLFVSREMRWHFILVAAIGMISILFVIGSRSSILMVCIACAFKFAQSKRLSLLWLYLSLPLIGFFLVSYGYFARYSNIYSTFSKFLETHGGIFTVLFSGSDISLAEVISINLSNPIIERPFYAFVFSGLIAFIPRAWIPYKMYGASTDFTMAIDLKRWMTVQNEWTITGFINLYYEFGYFAAVLISGLLAYLWTRLLISASRNPISIVFAGLFCIQAMYIFIRADVYNLCLQLWSFLIVLGIFRILKVIGKIKSSG